jgi:alkylation response protein AidB-like acyl-CoA dehydrogenase
MSEYKAPVQDSLFSLRTFGHLGELAASDTYSFADYDTIETVMEEYGRFFAEVFGPVNAIGDSKGLKWTPEGVETPDEFKPAYEKYLAAGWQGFGADPHYGGSGMPHGVFSAAAEYMSGSNAALTMLPGLTIGAMELLERWGSEEQKEKYLPNMVAGVWSGTMNLTEPQAGSDVGLSTTRAVPQDDGTYLITGTKIFISFGDHDLTENIIHLVLARMPDAPPGTKGISLFLVPKFMVDDHGNLGERNDVKCVSIEEKMGIHASPTCVLSFGDDGGATGYLVGEPNKGMRAMFTMMNNARLAVGVQGVAIANASYQKAANYALERTQGRAIGEPDPGPAPIVRHPDVRRMLLTMRAHLEATRNLVIHAATCLDLAEITEGEESERWAEELELLTPIVKSFNTEIGVEVTSLAVQVFGGMGYIEESGVSQLYRDARIAPIYEGTNGIQAMDLVGRKLGIRMGAAVQDHLARMRTTLTEFQKAGDEFTASAHSLDSAIGQLESATKWVMENGMADPRDALAGASPYLMVYGYTFCAALMAEQAMAARREIAEGSINTEFLEAKVTSARFYCEQIAPRVAGLHPAVTAGHEVLFEIPEGELVRF